MGILHEGVHGPSGRGRAKSFADRVRDEVRFEVQVRIRLGASPPSGAAQAYDAEPALGEERGRRFAAGRTHCGRRGGTDRGLGGSTGTHGRTRRKREVLRLINQPRRVREDVGPAGQRL